MPIGVVDQVDDPKVADADPNEVTIREPGAADGARFGREGEDRTSESGGVTGWQASKLTLGSRRDLDRVAVLAHSLSEP